MGDTNTIGFSPIPSVERLAQTTIDVVASTPAAATALGIPIAADGDPPAALGVSRDRLSAAGFDGSVGSTLAIAGSNGATLVAVGIGDTSSLDATAVRNAG